MDIQKIRVLQRDPLNPLIFNVVIHDVMKAIREESRVDILIQPTGLKKQAGHAESKESLSEMKKNEINSNLKKTELVVFRNGGKICKEDDIYCDYRSKLLNSFGRENGSSNQKHE